MTSGDDVSGPEPRTPSEADLEARSQEARRLLHVDPTNALRTLDGISPVPPNSIHASAYQDVLVLRVIANSMLGLEGAAVRSARDLAAYGMGGQSRTEVAGWLLGHPGNGNALATLLIGSGCGTPACGHEAAVELALEAIKAHDDPRQRLEIATEFMEIRPDEPAFRVRRD